jgi:hypothetical protein
MSSEQIKDLIVPIKAHQEDDKPLIAPEQPAQKAEADDQKHENPNNSDQEAGDILSAPVQEEPMGTSKVLKTRADLINKINEISDRRGDDIKHLNLKRRRKKSLENILASKFAEAAEQEMEQQHTIHPDVRNALPEGTEARTQFALDCVFRLDLTLCALMEKGVSATDGFHGLTCEGFAKSIEENPTLTSEIKACWLEILSEPDNEWILESCTTSARLFLCHCYGLMNVLRQKQRKHVEFAIPPAAKLQRQNFPHQARENVAPRKHTGKLRDLMRERQKGRENNIDEKLMPLRAGGLAKSV